MCSNVCVWFQVRGVHATEAIVEDETIVEVPLECLITVEMGKATDVGRVVLAADLEMDAPKHVYLMLFMLTDRLNPKSHFKPYYDILPPTLSNMPIFWNAEELALLTGSYLLEQVISTSSCTVFIGSNPVVCSPGPFGVNPSGQA